MLKSSLCDYSDAYIRLSGTKTGKVLAPGNNGKDVIFKNCAPFPYCISKINNTQVDKVKDLDIVMLYNLIAFMAIL